MNMKARFAHAQWLGPIRRLSIFPVVSVLALQMLSGCAQGEIEEGLGAPIHQQDVSATQASLTPIPTVCTGTLFIKCNGKCYTRVELKDGCETCKAPYVFRDAFPNDKICVESGLKVIHQYENFFGPDNVEPACVANPSSCPFGAEQCKDGFVWRAAVPEDHVCVSPRSRELVQRENSEHRSHTIVWGN